MNQYHLRIQARELLDQFGQIILHGPPGTGKTLLAREVAAALLNSDADAVDNHPQFAIVQFHPAYNYEDFVRGIQVNAVDNNVAYNVVDRVFGEIAKRAADNGEPHVLVVDEINRANVSAVLGELIYGLEYRDKKIQTPYQVDGNAGLIVPRNLSVIGTMNTADRTIGQIDYAVRRRFAFLRCPPDESVVEKIGGDRALEFFHMADGVFEHLSADHDKEDVCIGHSYFLADGIELANKIIYQVVPILREYVKDGVLKRTKQAVDAIDAIEKEAEKLGKFSRVDEEIRSGDSWERPSKEGRIGWFWVHSESGSRCDPMHACQMVFTLIHDYVHRNSVKGLAELRNAFPDNCSHSGPVVVEMDENDKSGKYLVKQPIELGDKTLAVVRRTWERGSAYFGRFIERAGEFGYTIDANLRDDYRHFNVGDDESLGPNGERRHWGDCLKYGFISGGQGAHAIKAVRKLRRRLPIFAYRNGIGYVGFGVVTEKPQPIRKFQVNGKPLLECELQGKSALAINADDENACEWVVRVDWRKTKSDADAIRARRPIPGHTVCRINGSTMRRALEDGFDIRSRMDFELRDNDSDD